MADRIIRLAKIGLVFMLLLFGYSFFVDSTFVQWKADFRRQAIAQGIQPALLDTALRGVVPDHKVLRLDASQPEYSRAIWDYLDMAASEERVAVGRRLLEEQAPLLHQISAQYGVDETYLLAIWGMESSFGYNKGNYSLVRSLATLAAQGRPERRDFWRGQLLAALHIVQDGDMALKDLHGSWGGALGHTQFMPQTLRAHAVDFDGDGRRDLQNSLADALASTAHYLVESGWKSGLPWGEEVMLPINFAWGLAEPGNWQTVHYWRNTVGIKPVRGSQLAGSPDTLARVFLPAGYRGPAFLVYRNFQALLQYNRASSYALGVGHLADRIRGGGVLVAQWPRSMPALSHAEKAELQVLLSAVGYSTEGVDGLIGSNTRAALRRWQRDVGFPSDGYATFEQLYLLRAQTEIRLKTLPSIQEAAAP